MLSPTEQEEKYKKSGIDMLFYIGTGEKIFPSKESDPKPSWWFLRND